MSDTDGHGPGCIQTPMGWWECGVTCPMSGGPSAPSEHEAAASKYRRAAGVAAGLDTWPDRQALPTLRRVLEQLEFVHGGLADTVLSERQGAAKARVQNAVAWIRSAIAAIEGKP